MKKLRMALIGAGRLGGFHAQKMAARDDVELVAVVDPLPQQRQRVAAACRTRAEADCRRLLGQLDAAVVATPTSWHHPVALELLRSGIHVLVEKPICTALVEADELLAAARRRGLVLQVGHVERFNPAWTAVAAEIADAKYVEAVRSSPFTFRSTDIGVVLDLMIHDIDLVLSLVRSRVKRIEALGVAVLGGHEDVANARLEFESGTVATLSACRVSYEAMRRMQIWSPTAFAAIDFAAGKTTVVRPSEVLQRREFDVARLSESQTCYYQQHLAEELLPRVELAPEPADALALQLDDFVESIRAGRTPRVDGQAGREALAVAQRILARIAAHPWDNRPEGPVGPLVVPPPRVIPAFAVDPSAAVSPLSRREAG